MGTHLKIFSIVNSFVKIHRVVSTESGKNCMPEDVVELGSRYNLLRADKGLRWQRAVKHGGCGSGGG